MKRSLSILVVAIIVLGLTLSACTRSASGGPSDVPEAEATLPNPVSTQSQLMKDIIAGTQTAMAVPLDATPAEGEEVDGTEVVPEETDAESDDTSTTPAPAATATPKPLPTSTQGPPPVVELEYNTRTCNPGLYVCVVDIEKDKSVEVQGTYPWLQDKMELTFKMGPEGNYDFSKYVVAGTAKYEPDGSKGYGFKTTLNIPDALRGMETIVVLLETNNPNYYGSDFFSNK